MALSGILVASTSVIVTSLAQLSLKLGVEASKLPAGHSIASQMWAYFQSSYVIGGLFLYVVGAVLWLFALSQFELSLVYPFVSISFVLVVILSAVFLNEHISLLRILGVTLIVAGAIFVAKSS